MGQDLLGLDIGASSIKGVRLSKGFRGLQLLDVFEAPVKPLEGAETTKTDYLSEAHLTTLQSLISDGLIHKADRIAIALPGDRLSTHEISLPFSDRKKIAQIVPFEIESVLPFDLEEVCIDYMLLKKSGSKQAQKISQQNEETPAPTRSHLLVSAVQNKELNAILQALQKMGLDPAWVGGAAHAHFAFAHYFLGLKEQKIPDLLVIDFGAQRTALCHIQDGSLNWIRSIPIGTKDLDERLIRRCKLDQDALDTLRPELDLTATVTPGTQRIRPEDLEASLAPLISEIEKNLRVMHAPHLRSHPEQAEKKSSTSPRLHLCGGGSALKGLGSLLSSVLKMERVSIDPNKRSPSAKIKGIDRLDPEKISQVYATAFGIVLQESDGPPINFRQGEFAFGKETIARRQRLVTFSFFVVLLLSLLGADLYLHFEQQEQHYQNLKIELRAAFSEIFPKVRNIVDEVQQSRSAIDVLKKRSDFLGVGRQSPLSVLKNISDKIPDNLKIDVHNLVIDGLTVRIQAQTSSFEAVDRIRAALRSVEHFSQVEVSDAKATANQKHVRFRIKMSVSN